MNSPKDLFGNLTRDEKVKARTPYSELCRPYFNDDDIRNSIQNTTHIIRVLEGETMKAFGFVHIPKQDPVLAAAMEKAGLKSLSKPELHLLCGRYATPDGQKGSKLIVDRAVELARANGHNAIRIEPSEESREALVEKVYGPMGFTPVEGTSYLELRFPEGGSRFNVKRRSSKRHRRSRKHRKLRKLTTRRR